VGGCLSGVAEFGAGAELSHGFEKEAANDEPESRSHATALTGPMNRIGGGGGIRFSRYSIFSFDRVFREKESGCGHHADRLWNATFLAKHKGENHDDAIIARFSIVVKGSKRSASLSGNLVGNNLVEKSIVGGTAWTGEKDNAGIDDPVGCGD
jgi:hypothetical protein